MDASMVGHRDSHSRRNSWSRCLPQSPAGSGYSINIFGQNKTKSMEKKNE